MRKPLLASLENEDEVVIPAEGDQEDTAAEDVSDEVLEAEETPEAGEAELEKAEDEAEEAVGHMDELEAAADELEDIEETLESFMEDGGMNPQAARMMHGRVTRLRAKLGRSKLDTMPSNEDFGGTASARRATQDSLEAVRDTIETVMNALRAAISYVVEKAQTFWNWVTNTAGRMKARLNKQANATKGLSGEAKEGEVSASGIAANLHVGGKVEAGTMVATINKAGTSASGLLSNFTKQRGEEMKTLTAAFEKAAKAEGSVDVGGGEVGDFLSKEVASVRNGATAAKGISGLSEGYVAKTVGDVFPGGYQGYLAIADTKEDEQALDVYAGIRSGVASASAEADKKAKELDKVDVLPATDVSKLCGAAAVLCNHVETYKAAASDRKAGMNKMEQAIKDLISSLKKKEDQGDAVKSARAVSRAMGRYQGGALGLPEQLSKRLLGTAKAASVYAARSAKQYGGDAEPAKKEEEAA